jgi:hypothetical protein
VSHEKWDVVLRMLEHTQVVPMEIELICWPCSKHDTADLQWTTSVLSQLLLLWLELKTLDMSENGKQQMSDVSART